AQVRLAGWVHRRRDHGGVIFIDLRDRSGLVQVVFNPVASSEAHKVAYDLRNEYVVMVEGQVIRRPAGTENPKMPTGQVEVLAQGLKVLNTSRTPPFYVNEDVEVEEMLRLKYRYLDLRRERMKNNLILRHRVVKFLRDFMDSKGFIEVETPVMMKSTPEGSRDYLVPSRLHPGRFYALPQSPQQLKQILMVAGIEKYYQIARCFRDEDLRADRQPEFTQLDLEMSFIDEEDILGLLEEMLTSLVETVTPQFRVLKPFPRLRYEDVIERYGSDKPDIRFGLELADLSDIFARSELAMFQSALKEGGKVKGIAVPGCAGYSRKQLQELTDYAKACGAPGLLTIALTGELSSQDEKLDPERVKSAITRYLTASQLRQMAERTKARAGDLLLIVVGKPEAVNTGLNALRAEMGRRLKLTDPNLLAFFFVVDFPMFEWNPDENHWQPVHHPFTAPREEDEALIDTHPEKVRSRHYDVVCNGYELSSGSIRIHHAPLQEKIFKILGYSDAEIADRFGHLLEAFAYGAPPHGGIAPGIDRLVMLLAGENNIREVIAFPKTQSATDLLRNAPSCVSDAQLKELNLCLREPPMEPVPEERPRGHAANI
ncbi:MAG: aspartate--tRNA ligase, partial [Chloroflexi bacterium]|nr:aspartate--tRNA ligase [Chloroflexota bacterium]